MLACAMLLAYLLSVYRYLMLLNQNKATLKRKKIPKMLRLFRDNWCFLVMICLSSLILDAELCPSPLCFEMSQGFLFSWPDVDCVCLYAYCGVDTYATGSTKSWRKLERSLIWSSKLLAAPKEC